MIKVVKLTVAHFRGIKSISLDLAGKNFAVCGPNGSGKSGIVDALEFVLTGNVSRLSGGGTGGLSVREHGPHVDSTADQAFVEAEVLVGTDGARAVIRRTVKQPRRPTIKPDGPAVRAALAELEGHPEFVLSRREIIKFILAQPSKRSELVQTLLRLDELDAVRATFTKIANAEERTAKQSARAERDASADLARSLVIEEPRAIPLLAAANERRRVLGLQPLAELTATTSLRDGLVGSTTAAAGPISKTRVQTELAAAREQLGCLRGKDLADASETALVALAELEADLGLLEGANRESMLRTALDLYDETCPVCGTGFEPETFQRVVNERLSALGAAAERRLHLEAKLDPLADAFEQVAKALKAAASWAHLASDPVDASGLASGATTLSSAAAALRKVLPVDATVEALRTELDTGGLVTVLDRLDSAAAALPEPTDQDSARDFLTLADAKLEQYRRCRLAARDANVRSALAAETSDAFGSVLTKALEDIFDAVRDRFGKLYGLVNRDDEKSFSARLTQEPGRLELAVDFFGRGFFPPVAYHSEGHQDGMGLCLYLALTGHLLGDKFSVAILDDVLMSVDAGHRREFSRLLKTEFPDTQFILTTHDPIWLKHMATEGLISPTAHARFRKWDVDSGPAQWDIMDVWADIEGCLEGDDVEKAAATLRRYLEYIGEEICHALRARVEFSADAHFTLGDTFPHGVSALTNLLKDGRLAATKWNKPEVVARLRSAEEDLAVARKAADIEQWQVNKAVHYDAWRTFRKEDFAPVVSAFKTLVGLFHCSDCRGLLRVSPHRGQKDALRCACGTVQVNLNPP